MKKLLSLLTALVLGMGLSQLLSHETPDWFLWVLVLVLHVRLYRLEMDKK